MLGFVILSHNNPDQLLRLVQSLNEVYDRPAIACHHDFSQSHLDKDMFPDNVHFVEKSITTGWGKWSLVEAALKGLRLLYDKADPEWISLLSSADYPVAPAQDVFDDLNATKVDAFLDFRPLEGPGDPSLAVTCNPCHAHHGSAGNIALAKHRYIAAIVRIPIVRFKGPQFSTSKHSRIRLGRHTLALPFRSPLSPFSDDFRCYVGSQWFTARRNVAHLLLSPSPRHRKLRRHLRSRVVPDECYFQTVICNEPSLTVDNDPRRFVQWNGGGAHPAELTLADLPDIEASQAFFARKFGRDTEVLDALDAQLDRASQQGTGALS